MRLIMSAMPENRHTILFSATLSHEFESLVREFLREPIRITVKKEILPLMLSRILSV